MAPEAPRLHRVQCLGSGGLHRMAYWEWGDAANPWVVVCVHGLLRQGRDFDALARSLASHCRVVCPDVVGRGRSDWLNDPRGYAVPAYVGDMVTLLARLDATQVDWVGTSMGGLIGMGLASMDQSPIRRLVLNDVGPRMEYSALQRVVQYVGSSPEWDTYEQAALALTERYQGFGPLSCEQWEELTRPQLMQTPAQRWSCRHDPRIAEAFSSLTPEIVAAGEAVLWESWDRIRSPTLLLRGAQSDLLSPETALEMSRRGPGAERVAFEGVGHAPSLVIAEQIDTIRRFLLG